MASANTLCKKLLNVKNTVVESHDFYSDKDGVVHLRIKARPSAWHRDDCPFCGRRCPGYDRPVKNRKVWRGLDFGGILVEIEADTHRIHCPEHGVVTAAVPWAYPGSSFTRDFDLTVTWLAEYLSRSAVANCMRIDWQTVGSYISRSLHDPEPERAKRLDGLVNIGIDEASYRKGHKYITVVVNHNTNTVVWVGNGDGARWITECVNKFTPDCERCVDPFHVIAWAMEALDAVRKERWHAAHEKAMKLVNDHPQKRGKPRADDRNAAMVHDARKAAPEIKGAVYSLGKVPEHLTENQKIRLNIIEANDPQLFRAYRLKESLRLLLKSTDVDQAEEDLKHWLFWASHSRIPAFKELYKKIRRHKGHILNTIRLGLSNARIEATNNKIKLIIRKAYGFRNIQNMMDMVCSNIRVPLPNRKPKAEKSA